MIYFYKKILMKYNYLILFFITFSLISCVNTWNNKTNVNLNASGSIISTWTIVWSGSTWEVIVEKPLTLEEKEALIITDKEAIKILKENKSDEYSEELPRIVWYYWTTPFYEFYILQSIKNSDIWECDNISIEDKKSLCKELYPDYMDENKVVEIYWKYWENSDFAKVMYKSFVNIKLENSTCENENIISYLACKKTLDKDFDVEKVFLNYSRLLYSDAYDVKSYYKEISEKWWMDKWFTDLVEKIWIDYQEKLPQTENKNQDTIEENN